jgi:hypothetical protein
MASTKVLEILANLTNKEKVEIVREIVSSVDIRMSISIFCCSSCDKIKDSEDIILCEFCGIVKCEGCVDENMISYQKCEKCIEKVCGKCGVELYGLRKVTKCRLCSQRFCKACKYVKTDTCISCLSKDESDEEEDE